MPPRSGRTDAAASGQFRPERERKEDPMHVTVLDLLALVVLLILLRENK